MPPLGLEATTSVTLAVNAWMWQITGLGQVKTGVSELEKVTQQNAGNSDELASGAEETASQVTSLLELVRQFKTSEGATGSSQSKHAAAKH